MRVLGLDPSLTATGAVLLDERGEVEFAESWSPPKGVIGLERLAWFDRMMVRGIEDLWQPARVAIEGYSFGSVSHAHALGELGGVLRMVAFHCGIEVVEIPPTTWRKELFGKGNLVKDQVRLQLYKRFKMEFDSMDVAEAWCIAMCEWRRHRD